ncbi:MAG: hypothetical protein R3263_13380, partial [Myxococcota bacterium]|nr:hypothetical protein [Myxococcota bacterium]
MSRFTVILVPDETTDQVRRYRVSRHWLPRAAVAAGVAVVLVAALVFDYVRLRRDAVEVEALRAESAAHQQDLERLGAQVGALEAEFGRLQELERKVRVIANLPGAILAAQVPEAVGAGQGGGDDEAAPGAAAAP